MSEELKPANQHPDFGKVCSHGRLKRKCYTCELEEDVDRLKSEVEELKKKISLMTYRPDCGCGMGNECLVMKGISK